MSKIGEIHVHKGGRPDAFFSFINSRYISRPLVPVLIRFGFKNPNLVSSLSFVILVGTTVLLLLLDRTLLTNRIFITLLIEFSFILDCADGQITRSINKKSLFGGWLDKYFDRIGEMFLYTTIGYITWQDFGSFYYFILGVLTGFLFSHYSLIYAEKDSIFFEEFKKGGYGVKTVLKKEHEKSKDKDEFFGKKYLRGSVLRRFVRISFFYINIGMGERYLYPIVFILLNRTNLMLLIMIPIFFIRTMNVTFILAKHLMRNKMDVKI